MINLQSFKRVIIASITFSVRITVHGFAEPCLPNASVDLTNLKPDFSGFVQKADYIFPSNMTWSKDGKTFGCPCSFKTCLPLCCPPGKAWQYRNCVEDNITLESLPKIITSVESHSLENFNPEKDYHTFINDPCEVSWMVSFLVINFKIFENGSIFTQDFDGGSFLDFEEYCLTRKPKSSEYSAKVCRPLIIRSNFLICCSVIAIFITLTIFIIYTVVPELRNFHGLIFRCYVITYCAAYVCGLGLALTTESRIYASLFTFSGDMKMTGRYFCSCCGTWLNIMCFNIWRSFRGMRQILTKQEERKKFIRYAIYAWCSPVIAYAISGLIVFCTPYFRFDKIDDPFKQWGSAVVISIILLCNIFLLVSTTLNIRQQKRDITNLADGVGRHYDIDKKWLGLYFKLSLIMGVHIIAWPIILAWPTSVIINLVFALEVAQCILILITFAWKDNVKRYLLEKLKAIWITNII